MHPFCRASASSPSLARATLPALDTTSRPQLPSLALLPTELSVTRCGRSHRRPHRLARIEKLPQVSSNASNQTQDKKPSVWKGGGKGSCLETSYQSGRAVRREIENIAHQHEAGASAQNQLRGWIAKSKEALETLLEIKQNVNRQTVRSCDLKTNRTLSRTMEELQRELDVLSHQVSMDEMIREHCQRMLKKMAAVHRDNHVQIIAIERDTARHARLNCRSIPDAEFVVTGFDGKQLFFKQRASSIAVIDENHYTNRAAPAKRTAMVVPHPQVSALTSSAPLHTFPPMPKQLHLRRSLIARRWPRTAFIGVCKIEAYAASTGRVSCVTFPVGFLPYTSDYQCTRPPEGQHTQADQSQLRIERVQHYAKQILPCLVWTDKLDFQLPIRYRQARILSFRTYTTFHALLTIRLGKDFSLEIRCVDAHTLKTFLLTLTSECILATTGNYVKDWLENSAFQGDLFPSVCSKLFLEYTTRGFEVLYPGVKPRGRTQRHPAELSLLQNQVERLSDERQVLCSAMAVCARQAASRAMRKLEQLALRQ